MDLDRLSDEELTERSRAVGSAANNTDACLASSTSGIARKVAGWCLRISGDRQVAADLAQEVFLRVHGRLDDFRGGSRFSIWL